MKKNYIFLLLFLLFFLFIFRNWFFPGVISSGDLRIFYPSSFGDYYFHPFAWDWQQGNGIGGFESPFAWFYYSLAIPLIIGKTFNLNWQVVEKFFFFIPFLLLSFFSSLYFFRKLFPKNPFYLFGVLIYMLNTNIFMMVGGGQIVGISLAYAIFPFVFLQFVKIIDASNNAKRIYSSVIAGLVFTSLIFFDLRFAYMLAVTVSLYFFLEIKKTWKYVPMIFIIPFGIAGLLHTFWILPVLMSHQNPAVSLGSAFNSLQSVVYFSFAKLENTLSLLHPNWPENIFGKVGFMKPEFLLIPLFAYASLLFVKSLQVKDKTNSLVNSSLTENRLILIFALFGLIGAFLAKGANDPFGGIYLWMFQHIPGFVMFRDPTKWYTLTALSYSILIPFTVWNIYEQLKQHKKFSIFNFQFSVNSKNKIFNVENIFVLLFIIFWLFTIRQAVLGQLGGTFKVTTVPSEYVSFANYLTNQPQFSRTLWLPTTQRFAYSSANHPAVSAENLFNIYDERDLIKKLRQPGTEKMLQDAGVKYVIVPTDSQKELYIKNRAYSEQLYKEIVANISKIHWLRFDHRISGLAVFTIPNEKDHFFVESGIKDQESKITYKNINPVEYKVSVSNARKGDLLVFAESYDSHWIITDESGIKNQESSKPYDKIFNSFVLPKDGNYTLDMYYTPQKWVNVGFWISLGTLILVVGGLIVLRRKT